MSDDLVLAVNVNGVKQYVPRHFIELSAAGVPGFCFRLAPSVAAAEAASKQTSTAASKATTKEGK